MWTYAARRLLAAVPLLAGLLTINFFLAHAAPGDPFDIYASPELGLETRENLRKAYGLDRPLGVQYLKYMERVFLHFDLGYSFHKRQPVTDVILEALPNTLQLALAALIIELGLGVALGVLAAVRQGSLFDGAARVSTLIFYSMPSFYLGLVLLFLFGGGVAALHIFPASGMVDIVRHEAMGGLEKLWDRARHLALPALTLGIGGAAGVSRYMRGEMLEVIRQDYMRAARAKGLGEARVILRHGLRNALIPLITILGMSLPFLFSGAVIVENVFSWPGMGQVAISAAFGRDYPVFLGANLVLATMVVAGNLFADLLYAVVDPRMRRS